MQKDRDMPKVQDIRNGGPVRLTCMDCSRLSRWNLCAVRVCANGKVMGLKGNQCNFSMDEDLINARYMGTDHLSDGGAGASGTVIAP